MNKYILTSDNLEEQLGGDQSRSTPVARIEVIGSLELAEAIFELLKTTAPSDCCDITLSQGTETWKTLNKKFAFEGSRDFYAKHLGETYKG